MTTRIFVILAVILAYFGVSILFRKKRLSPFVGLEYLLIGFLLADLPIDTHALKPLLFPFLGWIGLLLGLQMKGEHLKGLTPAFYGRVALFTVSSVILIGMVYGLAHRHGEEAVTVGLALSAISFRTVSHYVPARGVENRHALFFVSVVPFVLLILVTAVHLSNIPPIRALLLICLIVLFSILGRFILQLGRERESLELLVLGLIVLQSETCAVFGLSPLVTAFFMGIYLANASPVGDQAFRSVYSDEKPLTMAFLILVGMLSGISGDPEMLFGILLMVLTAGGIRFMMLEIPFFGMKQLPSSWFLAPGSLAIAIAADHWVHAGSTMYSEWYPSLLIAVMVLQFISSNTVQEGS